MGSGIGNANAHACTKPAWSQCCRGLIHLEEKSASRIRVLSGLPPRHGQAGSGLPADSWREQGQLYSIEDSASQWNCHDLAIYQQSFGPTSVSTPSE